MDCDSTIHTFGYIKRAKNRFISRDFSKALGGPSRELGNWSNQYLFMVSKAYCFELSLCANCINLRLRNESECLTTHLEYDDA
ncbi:hypothetical protein AcV5_001384 [Taiwanofungus camphoratus]|nr:hypothetical protein AcV5_001384 [Antrodia cinnamomea]